MGIKPKSMWKQRLTIAAIFLILTFLVYGVANGQYIRKGNDSVYTKVIASPPVGAYIDRTTNIKYTLYRSIHGKLYYWRMSKTGHFYRVYPREG